jgi:hypothetical protein
MNVCPRLSAPCYRVHVQTLRRADRLSKEFCQMCKQLKLPICEGGRVLQWTVQPSHEASKQQHKYSTALTPCSRQTFSRRCHSGAQEIPRRLWNQHSDYSVHKSPRMVPTLRQIYPVHTHFIFLRCISILYSSLSIGFQNGLVFRLHLCMYVFVSRWLLYVVRYLVWNMENEVTFACCTIWTTNV